ncbi:MAG TPA: PIN domain-containing protein [Cryomorphaceae bacterium]|nr:PIN domain-containing protein [Cryomorphaceae bacterium]
MKYLLDTNICVHLLRGQFDLDQKLSSVGIENCAISEITLAELAYGASKSNDPEKNYSLIELISEEIKVLPIYNGIRFYADEKARLRKMGNMISDFDLLIGGNS